MNSRPSFFPIAAEIVGAAHGVQRPMPLLDTREAYDALLCGYDRPCDPSDGEGLIIEDTSSCGVASVAIITPNGELIGEAAIKATIRALQGVLAAQAQRVA